jgi:hypothetical protein
MSEWLVCLAPRAELHLIRAVIGIAENRKAKISAASHAPEPSVPPDRLV